jgi:AcrR family transcriptional regulator
MSPRTEEQFKEIREKRKAHIRDVALEVFALEGYHGASISKIAKKAGISKGLLYNYFDSKEDVIRDILENGIDMMLEGLDLNKDGVLERSEMEFYINDIFDKIKANPEFWRLYFSISLQPAIYNLIQEKINEMFTPLYRMAVNYFDNQGFEDPEGETMLFAALLDGLGFHFILEPDHYPLEKVKQILINRYVKFTRK